MALTGVYRQTLQQIFSIQIQDELSQGSNTESGNNGLSVFPTIHEFNNVEQNANKQNNSIQTAKVENIQNVQKQESEELTNNYIDSEFAAFFAEEDVA